MNYINLTNLINFPTKVVSLHPYFKNQSDEKIIHSNDVYGGLSLCFCARETS